MNDEMPGELIKAMIHQNFVNEKYLPLDSTMELICKIGFIGYDTHFSDQLARTLMLDLIDKKFPGLLQPENLFE